MCRIVGPHSAPVPVGQLALAVQPDAYPNEIVNTTRAWLNTGAIEFITLTVVFTLGWFQLFSEYDWIVQNSLQSPE